ncbi:hypothetical protein [Sinorhizobium meliloti]|uniref:hypothetical protein n=1 Tax=Rhizobium meliloti TaxID=382 RepID=UPI00299D9B48|nr:hypothetical protein [Sinorhizobium meliloti]MDW9693226.1 hypothetical protein [Sinorhizobium meliloti]MDW9718153.1 hypothetical protein [Sinorhizobium meliloti]MDW9755312.1 hypothetical protein [Sinorhizobium meliloti]
MDSEERFKALESAAIEAAAQGLKALLLLNGGACVALLAFVGGLATSEHVRPEFAPLVPAATQALIWFASGSGVAVLACFFAYWTNQAYANALFNPQKHSWKSGTRLNIAGGTAALFSLFCFGKGVLDIGLALV